MSRSNEAVRPLVANQLRELERLAEPYLGAFGEREDKSDGSPAGMKAAKAAQNAVLELVLGRIDQDLLEAAEESKRPGTPDELDVRLERLAAGLGSVFVLELGLCWVFVEGETGVGEVALQLPKEAGSSGDGAPVLFFPRRIVLRQVSQEQPTKAKSLVDTTRAYISLLRRYFPAITGLES